jgi:hypothetical protein
MHSLDLLATPLPSRTTWRTWRLKPSILAHLMRGHSHNREVPQGVENCFMDANGSNPSLGQLREPGAASALAVCLASSRDEDTQKLGTIAGGCVSGSLSHSGSLLPGPSAGVYP